MLRTHRLGELNAELIGETVTLTGWVDRRRDHGGVAFLDLRDASGVAQVVVRDEKDFHPLRNEFVLQIQGTVERRPEGNENPNLPSGEIEVIAETVTVLNTAAPLPFQIDEHVEVGEEARLKYRYLDLRRPEPARIMRLRSEASRVVTPSTTAIRISPTPRVFSSFITFSQNLAPSLCSIQRPRTCFWPSVSSASAT